MKMLSIFYSVIIAYTFFLVLKFYYVKFDFRGFGNVLWYKIIEPPLPPQTVKWLQNWTNKAHRLKALGIKDERIDQVRQELPNILFILADDLGFNELSDYSFAPDTLGTRIGADTPFINSIRRNGINFAQSYSGHSTCTPSRAALLTGCYSTKLGIEFTPTPPFLARFATRKRADDEVQPIFHEEVYDNAPHLHDLTLISRDTAMIADYLDHAGYHSYFLGKWDSGYGPERSPRKHGYDESLDFPYGGSLYTYNGDPEIITPGEFHADLDWILTATLGFFVQHNDGPRFQPDRYMTDFLTEQGVALIKELSAKEGPWHIMMSYNAVHNPFQALRSDYNSPDLQHVPSGIPRIYAAMLRALDRGVGKLIETLRATSQYDNTIVIFTSDNGGAEYTGISHINAPFRGWKLSLFEGGVRVPFLFQWPQMITPMEGRRDIHAVTSHLDVVPSFIDIIDRIIQKYIDIASDDTTCLSNISITTPHTDNFYRTSSMDGISFWPYINIDNPNFEETKVPKSRTLFWRSGHYKAIRFGDWKMQVAKHPNKVWFFNLKLDPIEHHNLASSLLHLHTEEEVTNYCTLQYHSTDMQNTTLESFEQMRVDDTDISYNGRMLCAVFYKLVSEDAGQRPPLWQPLSELPLCIDRVGGFGTTLKCRLTDEYVVIPN